MKIGMITDSLGELSFDALLDTAAELGIEQLEFAGGNWSRAPHLVLDALLDSAAARREFAARLADHGITISALNRQESVNMTLVTYDAPSAGLLPPIPVELQQEFQKAQSARANTK